MNTLAPKVETKQRILDSAERLFADRGSDATSLRTIIADAKVNLAAIHYHFHSKEALLEAVMLRRLQPINQERLKLLDACEGDANGGSPSLEDVLEAFIAPVVRVGAEQAGGKTFGRLVGRILSDEKSVLPHTFKKHFGVVIDRFMQAFQNAAPDLPPNELFWRMSFAAGLMAHTLLCGRDIEAFSGGLCDTADVEGTIRRMVSFAAAGFRAPVPGVKDV
jgi:AcrR family transcriptional regulator